MKVAITLNDVVRQHYGEVLKFIEAHKIENESLGEVFELDDNGDPIPVDIVENNQKIKLLPEKIDNYKYSSVYPLLTEEDYNELVFDKAPFTLYGKASLTYEKAASDFNKLYGEIIKDHTCTLLSQERENSRSATFNFISVNKLLPSNVKLLYNYSKVWQLYDVIITANPYILKKKNLENQKKISIKIITDYNKDIKADYEFRNINEVLSMF